MVYLSNNTIPLDSVILDPQNESDLVDRAKVTAYNASGGLLNDFSDNNPLAALIQGQAFAASELLFYINQLPLALVVDFLKVTGVQQSVGTKSVTLLNFTLSAPQSVTYTIPEGFEVVDISGTYSFFTDASLQIPPGLISGSVTATAEEVGSAYNLSAYTINRSTQPLSFLSQVTNTEGSAGGTDAETIDQTISRALDQLKLRNLVSADDYEIAAQELLGAGSVAKAIGLLAQNKITEELGAVHLFLLNANQDPANTTQLSNIKNSLNSRIQLGTRLYVSPMELLNISGELIAQLLPGANADTAISELWSAFTNYLNPSTYPLGHDIILSEVEYQLRLTGQVNNIQTLLLNGSPLNIPFPNEYTLPLPYNLLITLVDDNGVTYTALRGEGE